MSVTSDVFGPLVGPYTIEHAIVTHLRAWLWPTYLEATETTAGLTVGTVQKPDKAAIYGVFDQEDMLGDRIPGVMVACTTPEGEPERTAGGYSQQYQVQLIALVRNDDTSTARRDAGIYGVAAQAAMLEQFPGAYPDLVSDLWLTSSPTIELPNTDVRTVVACRVEMKVFVSLMVSDRLGPAAPLPPGATPAEWPEVTETDVTVFAEPLGS
jgi:hypothetical protein